MADSNITKKALANALKELMETKAFEKISIKDICDRCKMNRKSFYYHFKDKYDLVNWIFDTEFLTAVHNVEEPSLDQFLAVLCSFFYENRSFYRKALCIKGQNSFSEHFRELLFPVITDRIHSIINDTEDLSFQINFLADATVMGFQRWIVDYTDMPPEEFIHQLNLITHYIATQYGDIS